MAFTGFSKDGVTFFRQLAARQDRDWFKAHKADYAALWEAPFQALLDDIGPRVAKQYGGLKLAAPKIFRIYRDVRFSKDKSPFKTNVAAVIVAQGGFESGAAAALYVHLGLEDAAGAGHWAMQPGQLSKYRALLDDPKSGAELQKKVDALVRKGFAVDSFEALKRVPKPFDPDHPRGELLKRKGLGFTFPKIPASVRYSAGLSKWLVERSAEVAPLVTWLDARL